jgi:hypothetical protein
MKTPGGMARATEHGAASSTLHASEPEVGSVQWGNGAPEYVLQARLNHIRPDDVAALWHKRWGGGTATVEIRLKTRGWSAAQLAKNASGNFGVDWKDGSLFASLSSSHRISSSTDATPATRFQRLDAEGTIRKQTLVFDSGHITFVPPYPSHPIAVSRIQSLSGSVTFSRVLDLRLQPSGLSISGPLDAPVATAKPSETAVRGTTVPTPF